MTSLKLSASALIIAALASTAAAQDRSSKDVALTAFTDAYGNKDYKDARRIFEEVLLPGFKEVVEANPKLEFQYCNALYEIGQKSKKDIEVAEEKTQSLIDRQPKYVEARYLYAKILSHQKKEEAKEQLITAAQLGLPVLRELSAKSNKKLFEWLLDQPAFVLEVMKTSNTVTNVTVASNPFNLPYSVDGEESTGTGTTESKGELDPTVKSEELKELEGKIDTLFSDIEALVERQEYDGLLAKFQEVNGLMRAYGKIGASKLIDEKLKDWEKRKQKGNFPQIILALQLQRYVEEGNQHILAMSTALQKEDFEAVFLKFQEVTALVDKIREVDNEEYKRNAEYLFYRAKDLNEKAIKRKRIKELNLAITGIIIDPGPAIEGRLNGHSAIINDKIYRVDDEITDDRENPIKGLVVKDILEGSVRFKYLDTTFVRELTPREE